MEKLSNGCSGWQFPAVVVFPGVRLTCQGSARPKTDLQIDMLVSAAQFCSLGCIGSQRQAYNYPINLAQKEPPE